MLLAPGYGTKRRDKQAGPAGAAPPPEERPGTGGGWKSGGPRALLLARGYAINDGHIQAVLARTARPIPETREALARYVTELFKRVQPQGAESEVDRLHALALEDLERELFGRAIKLAHGNQAKAARWLGVSRLTMREKLNGFGFHPAQERDFSED